ncbi:hypothetical protein ULMS_21180 [Patiriisocius marinistellae]|uniref:Uncharacterized protein n=1 Tax=Patiriisocius marinistellae TaxID=2494560 RepID=A0A5J4FWN4_9FLAO|nr:hypothetical protein [Patiriisocius marinistellae]GEQ86610.1 hypothetical protein ULMS_21180 [Patiriisocius marinistellae]
MIARTNIKTQLEKTRAKRIDEKEILCKVQEIFKKNQKERDVIKNRLETKNILNENRFNIDLLISENIFHIEDIKKLCIDYRLRFLDSHYFKGPYPDEAISKIRSLENMHDTTLKGFKIVAPAKLMKLENADDPLLFSPMGNDYYYLVHKWGTDLHPFRKAQMWPYKSFENLVFTILLVSIFLTMITPMHLFSRRDLNQEYLMLFLFMFKGVAGVVLFYGFSKGKNFNGAIWNSKYYNA